MGHSEEPRMTAKILRFPARQRGHVTEIAMWYLAGVGLICGLLGLWGVLQWILY